MKLSKKLLAYSAMAGPFILLTDNLQAQITYVDIEPDLFIPETPPYVDLDLNGDGIFELKPRQFSILGNCYGNIGIDHYDVSAFTTGELFWQPFNFGDVLTGPYTTDYNSPYLGIFYAPDENLGPFIDAGDKYIGFKFHAGGLINFGWARVNVTSCSQTIKDYAYSIAPIAAGEGMVADECLPPNPLGYISVSPTSVKVKWMPVAGAVNYQIKYRLLGAPTWMNKNVSAPASIKKLNGLVCDADYEWKIRVECADGELSPYSALASFTTADCKLNTTENPELHIFPNPAANTIVISTQFDDYENAMIIIYDMTGKNVLSSNLTVESESIDISILSNGMYFIELQYDEAILRKELMVQK